MLSTMGGALDSLLADMVRLDRWSALVSPDSQETVLSVTMLTSAPPLVVMSWRRAQIQSVLTRAAARMATQETESSVLTRMSALKGFTTVIDHLVYAPILWEVFRARVSLAIPETALLALK